MKPLFMVKKTYCLVRGTAEFLRGNIARLATVAYWSYPSFPTPSERQRKYKYKKKPT